MDEVSATSLSLAGRQTTILEARNENNVRLITRILSVVREGYEETVGAELKIALADKYQEGMADAITVVHLMSIEHPDDFLLKAIHVGLVELAKKVAAQ